MTVFLMLFILLGFFPVENEAFTCLQICVDAHGVSEKEMSDKRNLASGFFFHSPEHFCSLSLFFFHTEMSNQVFDSFFSPKRGL